MSRARKPGGPRPRSIGQIGRLRSIADNDADFVEAQDMLAELREDNLALTARMRAVHVTCDEYDDVGTASLLEDWIEEAETRIWFLFESRQRGDN